MRFALLELISKIHNNLIKYFKLFEYVTGNSLHFCRLPARKISHDNIRFQVFKF